MNKRVFFSPYRHWESRWWPEM